MTSINQTSKEIVSAVETSGARIATARDAIGTVIFMPFVVISYIILQPLSDEPRQWSGEDSLPV